MDNGLAGFTDQTLRAGEQGGVFAPELGGAVLVLDVDIFAALGFDQVMDALGRHHDKVRLVVAEVGGRIRVGDGEAEAGGPGRPLEQDIV